jgi:hypothetical protein
LRFVTAHGTAEHAVAAETAVHTVTTKSGRAAIDATAAAQVVGQ